VLLTPCSCGLAQGVFDFARHLLGCPSDLLGHAVLVNVTAMAFSCLLVHAE
jgi:hypothetical protein